MKQRLSYLLTRSAVVAGLLLLLALGALLPRAHAHAAVSSENASARAAVAALAAGDPVVPWPDGFAATAGYAPLRLLGGWANPTGGCSSPVPLPPEFTPACKEHDLGYDMLRYAHRQGGELGPWARRSIDNRFAQRVHEACDVRTRAIGAAQCAALADIAAGAVRANSWRQRNLAPLPEPALPLTLVAGALVALAAGAAIRPGAAR
jgi:hypothetical protein